MVTRTETLAHGRALRTHPAAAAAFMQSLLGQKLAAVVVGQKDPKAIGAWGRGEHVPNAVSARRLRAAHQVALLLLERESQDTVRAWFVGLNPHLQDRTPAMMLAEDQAAEVLQAARAFVAGAGS